MRVHGHSAPCLSNTRIINITGQKINRLRCMSSEIKLDNNGDIGDIRMI